MIEPLTNAYHEIYSSQHGIEFYGLRDFYSLMKMLYDMATKNSRKLAASDVIKAIQRNFSGYNETITRYAFIKHLQTVMDFEDDNTPTIPVVQLIEENLNGFPNLERDYRYLLILTENLAALNLLYKIPQLESATVIFGSNFRQDLEYTQICRR